MEHGAWGKKKLDFKNKKDETSHPEGVKRPRELAKN